MAYIAELSHTYKNPIYYSNNNELVTSNCYDEENIKIIINDFNMTNYMDEAFIFKNIEMFNIIKERIFEAYGCISFQAIEIITIQEKIKLL